MATGGEAVSWIPNPQGRGTLGIVWPCLITTLLSAWIALHMNVHQTDRPQWRRLLKKLFFIIITIYAPELTLSYAAIQLLHARNLRFYVNNLKVKLWRDSPAIRERSSKESAHHCCPIANGQVSLEDEEMWTLEHGFFAYMGGIALKMSDALREQTSPSNGDAISLTSAGVRLLSRHQMLPSISTKTIRNKTNPGYLLQFIVLFQNLWMLLQTISRLTNDLPITLLEITALAQVFGSMVIYVVWWRKPRDIRDPIMIDLTECPTCLKILQRNNFSERHVTNCLPEDSILDLLHGKVKITVPEPGSRYIVLLVSISILVYGGIYASAWNSSFPTRAEELIWQVATCVMTAVAIVFLICGMLLFLGAEDKLWVVVVQNIGVGIYVLMRSLLIVESISSLRKLPLGAFETPASWVNNMPHVG
jgi:hypothetical protein